ncbi:MAG: hypothetical protein IKZ29_02810 [Clostridiales bacterium]|nr:hypothetical protein [Clostridiales bacterium]
MSNYDDYMIDSAAEKVKKYGSKLNNNEYYAVMTRASVGGQYGQLARDILATAKEQNWEAFSEVSYYRDKSREESLASMGTSLVNASGCFITTACLKRFKDNFDDDCYELTELRHLRDTFAMIQHPSDVEEYYRIGPVIVEAINTQPDCDEIYADIYENLVMTTISLSQVSYEAAYKHYKDYVNKLKARYCKEVIKS